MLLGDFTFARGRVYYRPGRKRKGRDDFDARPSPRILMAQDRVSSDAVSGTERDYSLNQNPAVGKRSPLNSKATGGGDRGFIAGYPATRITSGVGRDS